MTRIISLFLLALLALPLAAIAAEGTIDGVWLYRMDTPSGEVTADMTLKAEGGKLTGALVFGGSRKLEIQNGTIEGNQFKFTVKRDREQGGSMTYNMAGSFEGTKMTGTANTEMDGQPSKLEWSATRK